MPIFANALAFSKTLLTSKLVKRDPKNIIVVEIVDTFDSFSSLEDQADFASYLLFRPMDVHSQSSGQHLASARNRHRRVHVRNFAFL